MSERVAGVIGATGLVGECLLEALEQEGWDVAALSHNPQNATDSAIAWHSAATAELPRRELWISTAPIWLLPEYFERLAACGAKRVVALSYTICGGETLTYRGMARRVFIAQGYRPRLVTLPVTLFRLARPLGRLLPPRLRWLVVMMERMNQDLAFDDSAARRDLGYQPGNFAPPRRGVGNK